MSKTKSNLLYQTLYQILEACLPLITAPYLSRILGAEQLGIFSYSQSIINYFILFAMLGFANYGTREIALKDTKIDRSKTFFEIYALQVGISCFFIILYLLFIFTLGSNNKVIFTIQIVQLVGCCFNINWFFFGTQHFKKTTLIHSTIKVVDVILILLFVKNDDDLWIYVLIIGSGSLVSYVAMWLFMPAELLKVKIVGQDILKHFIPSFKLFIPVAAMSVYHTMDKTMLGIFSSNQQSGYYYNADKIINIPAGLLSGISTVMMPLMSDFIGKGKTESANNLFCLSLELTILIGAPMAFGIASVAEEFTPIFFGDGYTECVFLIILLSPVLLIKAYSFTVRYQYLIPHSMDKVYIYSVCIGAVVNLTLNSFLIRPYGAIGASIGTLVAEFIVCIWQFIAVKKLIDFKKAIMRSLIYVFVALLMFGVVYIVKGFITDIVARLIVGVCVGIVVYLTLILLYIKIFKRKDLLECCQLGAARRKDDKKEDC